MQPARIPGSFEGSWSGSSEAAFTPPGSDEQITPGIKDHISAHNLRGKPTSAVSRHLRLEVAELEAKIRRKESKLAQFQHIRSSQATTRMEQQYQELTEAEGRLREQKSTTDSPKIEKSRRGDASVSKAPIKQASKEQPNVAGSARKLAYVHGEGTAAKSINEILGRYDDLGPIQSKKTTQRRGKSYGINLNTEDTLHQRDSKVHNETTTPRDPIEVHPAKRAEQNHIDLFTQAFRGFPTPSKPDSSWIDSALKDTLPKLMTFAEVISSRQAQSRGAFAESDDPPTSSIDDFEDPPSSSIDPAIATAPSKSLGCNLCADWGCDQCKPEWFETLLHDEDEIECSDNPQGAWNADPPEYEGADWSSMTANEFHRHDSNLSSACNEQGCDDCDPESATDLAHVQEGDEEQAVCDGDWYTCGECSNCTGRVPPKKRLRQQTEKPAATPQSFADNIRFKNGVPHLRTTVTDELHPVSRSAVVNYIKSHFATENSGGAAKSQDQAHEQDTEDEMSSITGSISSSIFSRASRPHRPMFSACPPLSPATNVLAEVPQQFAGKGTPSLIVILKTAYRGSPDPITSFMKATRGEFLASEAADILSMCLGKLDMALAMYQGAGADHMRQLLEAWLSKKDGTAQLDAQDQESRVAVAGDEDGSDASSYHGYSYDRRPNSAKLTPRWGKTDLVAAKLGQDKTEFVVPSIDLAVQPRQSPFSKAIKATVARAETVAESDVENEPELHSTRDVDADLLKMKNDHPSRSWARIGRGLGMSAAACKARFKVLRKKEQDLQAAKEQQDQKDEEKKQQDKKINKNKQKVKKSKTKKQKSKAAALQDAFFDDDDIPETDPYALLHAWGDIADAHYHQDAAQGGGNAWGATVATGDGWGDNVVEDTGNTGWGSPKSWSRPLSKAASVVEERVHSNDQARDTPSPTQGWTDWYDRHNTTESATPAPKAYTITY
jgi:TolA-binding protein